MMQVHAEYAARGSTTPTGCGNGRRVYNYYWRVRNMSYKMTHWTAQRSIRSPSFYIWPGGYRMYLRLFPRQSGNNVYIHVGLTRGDYDESLRWPFALPHRLAVLDQSADTQMAQDLKSRLWHPSSLCSVFNWQRPSITGPADNYECVGLGFLQEELHTRGYLRNDSLLIRLSVCIDAE